MSALAPVTAAAVKADQALHQIWRDHAAGRLSDNQAQSQADAVEARKPSRGKGTGFAPIKANTPLLRRPPSECIWHRRRLAASGPMPPALAARFTVSELAAHRIIGDEFMQRGVCLLTIREIAVRAQVSKTTVKNAIRNAIGLRLLSRREQRRRGRLSDPNIIKITSREWLVWLRLGPLTKRAQAFTPLGSEIRSPQSTENNFLESFLARPSKTVPDVARSKWAGGKWSPPPYYPHQKFPRV
jgi:hypothetical protein